MNFLKEKQLFHPEHILTRNLKLIKVFGFSENINCNYIREEKALKIRISSPPSAFSNSTSSTFTICGKRKATIDTRIIITPATKLIMEIAPPLPCPNIEEIFPGFSKIGVRILSTIGPEVAIGITLIDSEMTLLAEKTLSRFQGDG